jgi:predicted acylesterase/phospholipase RssA
MNMATTNLVPQTAASSKRRKNTPSTIELVLGGGGVKGFAHVGFLKAVEELKINYGTITGVSIGSIIAVLYVNGFSTEEIETIFAQELKAITPKKLARSMLLPARLDRLIFAEEPVSLLTLMKDLVARYKLKPKSNLRLVAFNAITREPVVFSGKYYDLATAMAASCSIPFVFRPIENGEEVSLVTWLRHWVSRKLRQEPDHADESELLFDGGLFHPTPTDFCQGPAIVAKLGFASQKSSEDLAFADRLFHNLEKHAARILDALFPDPRGEHVVITVGSADVAALSFGISPSQQKALTGNAYLRSISALKTAIAQGRVPIK